jgi:hypothetical protein
MRNRPISLYAGERGLPVDIVAIVSQVGFPIAVAAYALIKLNSTIEKNTAMLTVIATKLGINDEVSK